MSSAETADNRAWLEGALVRLVRAAPENRLPDFGDLPIFETPLLGVADGDDPLFLEYRRAVSPRHFLPRSLLNERVRIGTGPGRISVVSWALPFAEDIRRSNRVSGWPSPLYSVARNNGGALILEVGRGLADLIREKGWAAVFPSSEDGYDAFRSKEHVFSSTWSERHVAYAAGLGRFSLNGALITPLGIHVRLASIVTNLPLAPSSRPGGHRAPCLEDGGTDCGVCIGRCPVGAVSGASLDKAKCNEMRKAVQTRSVESYAKSYRLIASPLTISGKRELGFSLGCALCQCGVPCEAMDPFR